MKAVQPAMTRRRRSRPGHHASGPVTRGSVGCVLAALRRASAAWKAPIVELIATQSGDPFLTLIGCILSLRTKDGTTAEASRRLFAHARTPAEMLALGRDRIQQLIYPVGFYRIKAGNICAICADLSRRFGGIVPDDIDSLLTLKGVGRKTANLVVGQAYQKPAICVDTHVHRISNRWGLVKTRTPEATEGALRKVLPRRFWIDYNRLLVAFGQSVCTPLSPRCSQCPVAGCCPRIGVTRSR